MLTESKFKELYEAAARLRAKGDDGAARLLLRLFDEGATAGGYGVVRLSFVLRDLAEIAGYTDESRALEARETREELVRRRDARENAARQGAADFNALQELVALNHALGEDKQSEKLAEDLKAKAEDNPESAEILRMLEGLRLENTFFGGAGNAEKIADQIQLERMKRTLLKLAGQVAEKIDGKPREDQILQSAKEIKALADRYRTQTVDEVPRDYEAKRRLVELSDKAAGLLERYKLVSGQAIRQKTQSQEARTWLEGLSQELTGLVTHYEISQYLLQDEELRDGILKLARKVASQISEYRVEEDFGTGGDGLMARYQSALAEKITRDGLLAYEALLRINDDAIAEKVGAWLLVLQRKTEMYKSLRDAAQRAGKTDIENRLSEEEERLTNA